MRSSKWILLLLFVMLTPVTVMASQPRHHRQTYEISIEVQCVEEAAFIINGLSGYSLDSSVNLGMHRPNAYFMRRVDSWAYLQVQETLRNLGEVLDEFELVTYLGSELTDIEAQLAINSGEVQRVSQMLEDSNSLDVMTLLSGRLGDLMFGRDLLMGRRNQILTQAGSPIIEIYLVQAIVPVAEEESLAIPLSTRIGNSFTTSVGGVGQFFGHIFVGLAFISVPLVLWSAICIPIVVWAVKRGRRANVNQLAFAATDATAEPPEIKKEDDQK